MMIVKTISVTVVALCLALAGHSQVAHVPDEEALTKKVVLLLDATSRQPLPRISFLLEINRHPVCAAEPESDSMGYAIVYIPSIVYHPKPNIVLTGVGKEKYTPVEKQLLFKGKASTKDTTIVYLKAI